jgi:SAM-dependent methyltransferase
MDRTERQREHFNKVAATYHRARQNRNHLLLKELMWREFFRDKNELKKSGLRVLEAMCGFADGQEILEHHLGVPVHYEGFDYSDTVVAALHERRPELAVWQANVEKFESDRTYDLVLLIGGLHHVPDAASGVVRRLAACLRSGGWFINLEPTHGNRLFQRIRERIYERNTLFDEETERAFPVEELLAMFANAGLTPVDVMYPGLLSYVLYYNPDAFPWLNAGGERLVRATFALDRWWFRTRMGRALSFATLGMWRKGADGRG